MNIALLILIVLALAALAGFYGGLRKIRHYLRAGGGATAPAVRLANIPSWYGWYVGLWALIPALLVWLSLTLAEGHTVRQLTHMGLEKQDISTEFNRQQWREIERYRHQEPRPAVLSLGGMDAETLIPVLEQAERQQSWFTLASVLLMVVLGIGWALPRVRPAFTARRQVERFIRSLLLLAAVLSVLVTVTIILSVVFESVRFFGKVPLTEFLFGTQWSPQTALRADQAGASGSFGAIPLFVGTFLIMIIAMIVAAPLGLLSAVYMSEYASPRFQAGAGGAGGHSHRGLRLFRHSDYCALPAIRRGRAGADHCFRKRTGRRTGDGGNADSLRFLPVGRCDYRRATLLA
jgi:phosphate transport system permease protein